MLIKLAELPAPQVYFTMTQTILPRPVAWVLSENPAGDYNLAPFSYFNAVCSDPPLIMISIGLQDDGRNKDTLENIQQRGEFVVHIASVGQLDDLNQSSATLPPGQSEVTAGKLDTTSVDGHHLPRLTDCAIAMMCSNYDIQKIGREQQQHLVFGQISDLYVADHCTHTNDSGRLQIDAAKIKPLSRLGANQYATFGDVLKVKRPA